MILVAVGHVTGLSILYKLLNLGFKPSDIVCLTYNIDKDIVNLLNKKVNIDFLPVESVNEVESAIGAGNFHYGINISGIPGKLSIDSITKFKYGIVNLHSADTEQYRGRWCASWNIIDNCAETAYTWHYMNKDFDTGNVLTKGFIKIESTDTAFTLHNKILSQAIGSFNEVHLKLLQKDKGYPPGMHGKYKSAKMPFNGTINKQWSDDTVERFIRAMHYPPYEPAKWVDEMNNVYYINSLQEYKNLKYH